MEREKFSPKKALLYRFPLTPALRSNHHQTDLCRGAAAAAAAVAEEAATAAAEEAAAFAATDWQAKNDCVTCHTNGLFLVAGAKSTAMEKPYQQSRAFATTYLDRYLKEGRAQQGQAERRGGSKGDIS